MEQPAEEVLKIEKLIIACLCLANNKIGTIVILIVSIRRRNSVQVANATKRFIRFL